jgi:hypothetical protein
VHWGPCCTFWAIIDERMVHKIVLESKLCFSLVLTGLQVICLQSFSILPLPGVINQLGVECFVLEG